LKENYTLLAFAPKSPEGDFLKHVDLLIVTISHFRDLGLFFQKEGVFFLTLIMILCNSNEIQNFHSIRFLKKRYTLVLNFF